MSGAIFRVVEAIPLIVNRVGSHSCMIGGRAQTDLAGPSLPVMNELLNLILKITSVYLTHSTKEC